MDKLEKVIKGVERCLGDDSVNACEQCPYEDECAKAVGKSPSPLRRDVLLLLKAQEPEKPICKQIVNEYEKYTEYINKAFCAKCGAEFVLRVNYCPCCGQAVKWNG